LIAYKQPMKQSIVIKIRGNKAYDHIRSFVERGLINKKRMGHTAELTLNENFFDYFSMTGGGDGNSFEITGKMPEQEEISEDSEKKEEGSIGENG